MPAYRAYFLDPDDHIIGTEIIEVETLSLAVGAAMALLKGLPEDQTVELWECERRLCSLPPAVYRRRAVTRALAPRSDLFATHLDLSEIVSRLAAARKHLCDEDRGPPVRQVLEAGSSSSPAPKSIDPVSGSDEGVPEHSRVKIARV